MLVLETPRLILRWFDGDDAPFIAELLNDPDWLRFIGDRGVRTADDARPWIASRLVAAYHRDGFGLWALETKEDRALIGMCGLIKRDSLPDVDVGYALHPRYRGMGYAREATAACLAHGHDILGLKRILAITHPDNLASVTVLERCGMRFEARTQLEGEDHEVLVFAWQAPPPPAL